MTGGRATGWPETGLPSGHRRRLPTREEHALWTSVNRDTVPMHRHRMAPDAGGASPRPAPVTHPRSASGETPLPIPARAAPQAFRDAPANTGFTPSPPPLDPLADRTPGLDRKTARALRRGERAPDMRIDLHGMNADRAHRALNGFIAQARKTGARCVLVITGKGGAYAARATGEAFGEGVLRREVPHWLRMPPLRDAVVGVYRAHPRHGGEGALYVYLRKTRG